MLKLKRDGTFETIQEEDSKGKPIERFKEIDTRPRYGANPLDIEQAERSARLETARLQKIEQNQAAETERQKKLAAQWAQNRA